MSTESSVMLKSDSVRLAGSVRKWKCMVIGGMSSLRRSEIKRGREFCKRLVNELKLTDDTTPG
jgi:hypothetical protein